MKKFVFFALSSLLSALVVPASAAAPSQPTNVNVVSSSPAGTATDAATATVSWTGSGDALSYSVAATPPSGPSVTGSLANCQGTSCTSSLANLTGGVEYSVVVTAVNDDPVDNETPSDPFNFEAESVPFEPTADAPALANGQITLSWTAGDNGGLGITKYVIRAEGFTVDVPPNQTTYSSSNFTVGQTYEFGIAAVNSLGESIEDTFTSITYASAPASPAQPSASVSGSSITATWTAPSNNGSTITAYSVYLVDDEGSDVGTALTPNPTNGTTLTINNVEPGDYTIQVTATNAQGTSPRSTPSSVVTVASGSLTNTPIFDPSSLATMDIGTSAALSVTAPSGGQVAVSVSASPAGACSFNAGQVTAVAAGTCTINASVPATSTYAQGSASKVITIKAAQSITFAPITSQTLPGPLALSATSTSGLAVRFSTAGNCSVSGSTVTFSSAGSCTVTASQPGNNAFSAAQQIVRAFEILAAPSQPPTGSNPPGRSSGVAPAPGTSPTPPSDGSGKSPSASSGAKVNAGSFKGYVALYAKGHKGKRFSAKVGKDWVVVPSLKSDFERIVEYTGVGYRIAVRLYIDRKLLATINLLTK